MFQHLLLLVLVDVKEVSWVEPGDREKVVLTLFGELLLESAEMYPEGIFPGDIIHA